MKGTDNDRRLYTFLLTFYLAAVVYVLITSSVQKHLGLAFSTYTWPTMMIWVFLNYLIKGFFLAIAVMATKNYFIKSLTLFQSGMVHFVFSLLFTFLSYSLLIPIENALLSQTETLSLNSIFIRSMQGANFGFFLYFSIISILYAALYLAKQQNQILGAERLKNQLLDAKMNSLRTQIQPHFLFNTLNSISYLTEVNAKKSRNAIADLSQILRYSLNIKTNHFVLLEEEFNCAKQYLSLMKMRFDDKLNYSFDLEKTHKKLKVPPFLLQPILENALHYGFSDQKDSMTIEIFSKLRKEVLSICIANNGEPLPKTFHYGTGIGNILMRLHQLFGDRYEFEMKNAENKVWTEISIPRI